MSEPNILYRVEDGVAILTLNRPEVRNAFEDGMREAMLDRLSAASSDDGVGCVVITGKGKAFAAGGDIRAMAAAQSANDVTSLAARMHIAAQVVSLIRAMPKPVIAAVNGAAAGGGCNLALACDLRYAAAGAFFVQSFVRIGLVPDWGGHYLLPRIVGSARAMEIMMLGDRIDAARAERIGIVNAVFPDDELMDRVSTIARRLAAGPRASIAAIKAGVERSATASMDEILAWESDTQCEVFLSDDAREGMRAFIDRRDPRFGTEKS